MKHYGCICFQNQVEPSDGCQNLTMSLRHGTAYCSDCLWKNPKDQQNDLRPVLVQPSWEELLGVRIGDVRYV